MTCSDRLGLRSILFSRLDLLDGTPRPALRRAAERDIRQLELIGGDYDALLDKATEMLRVFPEVYRTVAEHSGAR